MNRSSFVWMFPRVPSSKLLVALFALGSSSFVVPAAADAGKCQLVVRAAELGPDWKRAVADARRSAAENGGDCAGALIEVDGEEARLEFTMADGRRAVRVLHGPDELVPTLEALMTPLPSLARHEAPPPKVASNPPPSDGGPPKSPPPTGHLDVMALVGGRVAGPVTLVAPTLDVGASLVLEKWEIGVIANWDPIYVDLDGDDDLHPYRFSSIAAGIEAGRRIRLRSGLSLLAGVKLRAAILHEAWHEDDASSGQRVEHETERGQALVGAYAGALLPVTPSLRLRTTLTGDLDATHLGQNGAPIAGIPPLPWWGVTLAFGIESELL